MNGFAWQVSLVGLLVAIGVALPRAVSAQGLEKTTVAYREVDGHRILADVYRPAGNEIRPVLVFIHGGALIGGNREIFLEPEVLELAQDRRYTSILTGWSSQAPPRADISRW